MKSSWIIKIIPKSIRRMIFNAVDAELREYINVEAIKGYAVGAANTAILATKDKVDPAKMTRWCNGLESGSRAFATISKALNPNGEGGMTITEAEGEEIIAHIETACGSIVTEGWLDEIIENAESRVKGFLKLD